MYLLLLFLLTRYLSIFVLKDFDLTKHKLVHEGDLIWRINRTKTIGMSCECFAEDPFHVS